VALHLDPVIPVEFQIESPQRSQVDLTLRSKLQSAIGANDAACRHTGSYCSQLLELTGGEQAIADQYLARRRGLVAVIVVVEGEQLIDGAAVDLTSEGSVVGTRRRGLFPAPSTHVRQL
jgi:hypothetical protein